MVKPADYQYKHAETEEYFPEEDVPPTHEEHRRARKRIDKAIDGLPGLIPPLEVFDLNDNLHEEFDPLQWIIPDYLPEGLTLLFSRPKVGKSMLSLALSLRMARRVSGGVDGEVLYLTLDDTNKRRLQSRTRSLLQGEELEPGRVWCATHSQTLDGGLIVQLGYWMNEHPATKLVVIDVYARIKPKKQDDDVYKSDYNAIVKLQEFAVQHHIAILLVHHTRKQRDTEDWIDNINGSTGLSAGVDTLWTLERKSRSNDLTLRVKGRDTMGELAVGLTLDDLDSPWQLMGEDEELDVNATEQKILDALQSDESFSPKKVAELTGLKHTTVLGTLRRMLHKDLVAQTVYGNYRITKLQQENTCNSVILASDVTSEPAPQATPEKSHKELQELHCFIHPDRFHFVNEKGQQRCTICDAFLIRLEANAKKLDEANRVPSPEETQRILAGIRSKQ